MNLYIMGGSPCSGKSTIAEMLAEKFGFQYFRVDDCIDKYIEMGAKKGYPICQKQKVMNPEQIWMRDPQIQCEEEIAFYEETFAFAMEELKQIDAENGFLIY